MKNKRKTHHKMIREAIIKLGEARPKVVISYIRRNNPEIQVKDSSFRADLIGCSMNHSSSHHFPGMPKFLYYESGKGTYRLFDPQRDSNWETSAITQRMWKSRSTKLVKVTDKHVKVGQVLLKAFRNGEGLFSDSKSEVINDMGFDRDSYLNYITFTSAIDYQKNLEANELWKNAREWAKEYPWIFEPKGLHSKPVSQVVATFKRIRQEKPRFFRIQDIGIWLLIADALEDYDGKTSKLLEAFHLDAGEIHDRLSDPQVLKRKFPYLSGPKILPMWLKILKEEAGVKLKNMEGLPLPVDKNVAEATFNLIFQRQFDGKVNKEVRNTVRAAWNKIAAELGEIVINFDTALWILGGNRGCSDKQKEGCSRCPVREYCRLHVSA